MSPAKASAPFVIHKQQRDWNDLKAATGTVAAFDDLASALGIDLEGVRFEHRQTIMQVLKPFFDARTVEDFTDAFEKGKITWSRYRSFGKVVREDPDCSTDNPMFALEQPGIGSYLVPGHPVTFADHAGSTDACPGPRRGYRRDPHRDRL